MLQILLFLMLNISPATQPDQLFVASDSLFDKDGILRLGSQDGWRFQAGDDLNRANPDFDDRDWLFYKPAGLTEPIPDSLWQGYGWFRFRFAADSSVYAKVTHLYFSTWGAAEVYLDGNMVRKYGVFSLDKKSEKLSNPINKTHPAIVFQPSESHVLAVRFSYHKGQCFKKLFGKHARTFGFDTGLTTENLNQNIIASNYPKKPLVYILGTMMFLIVLLHISMYLLFPEEQSNLYISIVTFLLLLQIIATYLSHFFQVNVLQYLIFSRIPFIVLFMAALSMFPLTINYMFKQRHRLIHKILIWLFPVFALANFILAGFGNPNIVVSVIFSTVIIFFTSRVLIQSWRTKQKGVWIVAIAFLGVVIVAISWVFYIKLSKNFSIEIHSVMMYLIYGSIPFGLTAFTANRFRDLYKNLEQKVKERTWELNQSLENLRSTQTQLIQTEKMASLGQLTAGIAHEIQNPLNFVNNFSEVSNELIDEMKDELAAGNWQLATEIADDVKQNLEKINHHGKRADAIVKGMLQHSRSSNGHKEPTDINKLAGEYLRLSYHGMRAKDKSFNAEYKTDFDPTLPKINVVPQDIGRVLLNLINNAFYAVQVHAETRHALSLQQTSQNQPDYKPTIIVSTKNMGNHVEIRVKDNGSGIPPEIMDKIFQPFFTTKPTGSGTGLGLSLAYDIVKAHGGEIKVDTKVSEGSEFIIILPFKNN